MPETWQRAEPPSAHDAAEHWGVDSGSWGRMHVATLYESHLSTFDVAVASDFLLESWERMMRRVYLLDTVKVHSNVQAHWGVGCMLLH